MRFSHLTPIRPAREPCHHVYSSAGVRSALRAVVGVVATMLLLVGSACRELAVGPLDGDESEPALDHRPTHPLPRSFQLAFSSDRAGSEYGIYVMRRNGRDQMTIADLPATAPRWSPAM